LKCKQNLCPEFNLRSDNLCSINAMFTTELLELPLYFLDTKLLKDFRSTTKRLKSFTSLLMMFIVSSGVSSMTDQNAFTISGSAKTISAETHNS